MNYKHNRLHSVYHLNFITFIWPVLIIHPSNFGGRSWMWGGGEENLGINSTVIEFFTQDYKAT